MILKELPFAKSRIQILLKKVNLNIDDSSNDLQENVHYHLVTLNNRHYLHAQNNELLQQRMLPCNHSADKLLKINWCALVMKKDFLLMDNHQWLWQFAMH